MFGIGANELVLILLFGFLIFGPDKLPAMAKTIGQAIAKFRSAQDEMNKVIKNEVFDPTAEDPFKNPLDAASKIEKATKKEDKQESFTERKARYDKQRAAKKRAEERKAELAAKKAEREAAKAAEAAAGEGSQVADAAASATAAAVAKTESAAKSASSVSHPASKPKAAAEASKEDKPKVSLDDLYGTKPAAKKPAAKKPAEAAEAAQDSAVEAVAEEKGE